MENTEIREIGGKKYEANFCKLSNILLIKTPYTCSCHHTGALHMMACCNNGWKEHLREIK
jgi:hypothetical protein